MTQSTTETRLRWHGAAATRSGTRRAPAGSAGRTTASRTTSFPGPSQTNSVRRPSRRAVLSGGAGLGLMGLLSACGAPASGSDGGRTRFTWWGNEYLDRQTFKAIDAFVARHPEASVQGEPSQWGSYWDRLATQAAAGDAPDVINMDQKYIAEYGGRGVLADLNEIPGLELGALTDDALNAGTVDGKLFGVSTGRNTYVVVANKAVFDDAGVALPDDTTWTWDDYAETARAIQASGEDRVGALYGINEAYLVAWLRQKGQDLYTVDGAVGYEDAVLAEFFAQLLGFMESGTGLGASAAAEEDGLAMEQTAFGTNRAGMTWIWANQYGSYVDATDSELIMLRPPSFDGNAAANGAFYKPSMFWSLSAGSTENRTAVDFINFLVNDDEAATTLKVDRGAPANPETEDAILEVLGDNDRAFLDYMKLVEPEIAAAPPVPPPGSSEVQNVLRRYVQSVFFAELTPEQASADFTAEVESMIAGA